MSLEEVGGFSHKTCGVLRVRKGAMRAEVQGMTLKVLNRDEESVWFQIVGGEDGGLLDDPAIYRALAQDFDAATYPCGLDITFAAYDNGGVSIDRYTVAFEAEHSAFGMGLRDGLWTLSMNAAPFSPQGFCQHGEAFPYPMDEEPEGFGRRLRLDELPEDCQKVVQQEIHQVRGSYAAWLKETGAPYAKVVESPEHVGTTDFNAFLKPGREVLVEFHLQVPHEEEVGWLENQLGSTAMGLAEYVESGAHGLDQDSPFLDTVYRTDDPDNLITAIQKEFPGIEFEVRDDD